MQTLKARPGISGNSESDFTDAYMALSAALDSIDAAHRVVFSNVVNGRNYQHMPEDEAREAGIEDSRRIREAMDKARGLIGSVISEIADALLS